MRLAYLTRTPVMVTLALALSGCLDDGGSGSDDTSLGQLNFNGIGGLTYQTQSQRSITNSRGEFRYYPGETLSLWVGDLHLVDGVPAQRYVTPLEFVPENRTALTNAIVDDEGLSTHTLREQQLLDNRVVRNITRLLMVLNWTGDVRKGEKIDIRDRVISQLNRVLPTLSTPIDFTVTEAEFSESEAGLSPANQLLAEICFYPEDHPLCDEPPSEAEIALAPAEPENEEDREPGVSYREDLQSIRDAIIDAVRELNDVSSEEVETYIERELTAITTAVSNTYYLDEDVASHSASDTDLKSVGIRLIGGKAQLADVEAMSTRTDQVVIHAADWQRSELEYFVAGEAGGESELVISFRPEDTYRWVRKQLRVLIR